MRNDDKTGRGLIKEKGERQSEHIAFKSIYIIYTTLDRR